jgi:hypothetical protein
MEAAKSSEISVAINQLKRGHISDFISLTSIIFDYKTATMRNMCVPDF